jgi:hypothetical protein
MTNLNLKKEAKFKFMEMMAVNRNYVSEKELIMSNSKHTFHYYSQSAYHIFLDLKV